MSLPEGLCFSAKNKLLLSDDETHSTLSADVRRVHCKGLGNSYSNRHGAAVAGTTSLTKPISLLPRKNMALLKFISILGTDHFTRVKSVERIFLMNFMGRRFRLDCLDMQRQSRLGLAFGFRFDYPSTTI